MENKDTLYARWLSGELSPEEIKALKASGEWEELEAIVQATAKLSLPAMDLDAAYRGVTRPRKAAGSKIVRRNFYRAVSVAAAIAALAVLAIWLFFGTTEVKAAYAMNERHEFRDGSFAVLNDGSEVRYRKSSWGRERQVNLTGEAFFSVEKGAPFVVQSPKGKVEVLGTEFTVRNWGEHLYVACYEGKVAVTSAGRYIELSAGQSVDVLPGREVPVVEIQRNSPAWLTEGRSTFTNEEASAVLEEIGRQYNIRVQAPPLDDLFNGAFPHDDLGKALEFVCKPLGLQYAISPDQKSVTITR